MELEPSRHLLGVFLDFENLALGFRNGGAKFDIHRVLARLVEKGNIVVKRAYADWLRFSSQSGDLLEAAFELLQIPSRRLSGKNSADMRLCVDIMDLCYSKAHVDTFVIVSGDSDFSPLVSKLKENGRTVIGLGMKASTSALLRDNCHEFIYYEDLKRESDSVVPAKLVHSPEKEREVFTLLLDSLKALQRENRDVCHASLIKETMKRKSPSFNETYYGFRSFSKLLDAAAEKGLITLSVDADRHTHVVTGLGDEVRLSGSGGAAAVRAPRVPAARVSSTVSRGAAPPAREPAREPAPARASRAEPEPDASAEAPAKKKRRRRGRGGKGASAKGEGPPPSTFSEDELDDPRREEADDPF